MDDSTRNAFCLERAELTAGNAAQLFFSRVAALSLLPAAQPYRGVSISCALRRAQPASTHAAAPPPNQS